MTDRSNTLVNAGLSIESTLDLHFLIGLKNSDWAQKQRPSLPRVLQHC
jgi:hypothetical protein